MKVKLPKFIKSYHPKILVDRSFQRKVCWSDNKIRKFILSVNQNRTPYPLVVADIESGLEKSSESLDENSENYYREASRNYTHVSLDGLQRATALVKFYNNQVTVTGIFTDADGKKVSVTNKYFRDLPQRLQDKFNDYEVEIKVMEDLLRDELKDFFLNINDGEGLNDQEKRNAYPTSISKFIRDLSEKKITSDIWLNISGFNQTSINRSLDAELLLKAFMVTHPDDEYNANKKTMDSFYELGRNTSNISEYRPQVRDRFVSIMTIVSSLCSHQKVHVGRGKIPQRQWWACVFLAQEIYDKNLQVLNYADAYSEIYELEKTLIDLSKQKQGLDLQEHKASLDTSDPKKEPSDSNYYWHWASEPLKASERKKRLKDLFSEENKLVNVSPKPASSKAAK